MIDLNSICEEFFNAPPPDSLLKKITRKEEIRQDLLERAEKSRAIKDLLKIAGWQKVLRPKITATLREGFGKLLREEALHMTEAQLKTIIAEMRANISIIADMKYLIESGDDAARRIDKIK